MPCRRLISHSRTPLGKPIVSGVGSITSKARKLVDKHLQPHVTSLPSYVRDTMHLLQILDDIVVPIGSFLVGIDVETLYNSIPHTKGVATVRRFLFEQAQDTWPFSEFILEFFI